MYYFGDWDIQSMTCPWHIKYKWRNYHEQV